MPSALHWRFASFRLDPTTTCLWRDDQLVPLPPKSFAVLAYLVAHAGEVVTKETLLEAVWTGMVVSEGALKTCMSHIRHALGETGQALQYIATVHRRGYRFVAPVTVEAAPAPPPQAWLGPPVLCLAREAELGQLAQCWEQARQGTRQVVFITGEAGIGKTTLVDAFVAQTEATAPCWSARGQCLEQYEAGEAYLPLLEALGHLGRGPDGTYLLGLLRQQAPSWLAQLPGFLSDAADDALQHRSGGTTRERMLRELTEVIETLAREQPLVLVLEDLHWSDHATLDWLAFVAHRRVAARLLVLGTYRPVEAVIRGHPVRTVSQELQRHGQATELLLGSLPEAGVEAYLAQRFGATPWPDGFVRILHRCTNGNPFFLVTVLDDLVRRGMLEQRATGWALRGEVEAVAIGVPESVQQLIEHQLAQVSLEEQELLVAASVVGTSFTAAAVAGRGRPQGGRHRGAV